MEEYILNRKWTFWYDAPHFHRSFDEKNNKFKWFQNIKKIYSIESVVKFWQVYNNIIPPSQTKIYCSCILYQKDIKPVWYDLQNMSGGDLSFILSKQELESLNINVDEIWQLFLLSLIGESIEFADKINGISIINNRYYYEIRVSISDSDQTIHSNVILELKKIVEENIEGINEVEIDKILFYENKIFL
jgi:hypothetical protein